MRRFLFLLTLIAVTPPAARADDYRLPPQAIVDLIDADPAPTVDLSPDSNWMLLIERDAMPGIEDVSRRMLRLAGIRIDPAANRRFQSMFDKSLSLRSRDGGETTAVPLPPDSKLASTIWSHDSQSFVFSVVTPTGSQLWAAAVDNPGHPQLLTDRLMSVFSSFSWMPDGKQVVCAEVPSDRGAEPAASTAPTGPSIQETAGNTSPTRTYQDLLSSAEDEAMFEYYAVGQLTLIDLHGKQEAVGVPAIIAGAEPAPNGELLLVTTIHKPFSYVQTYSSFPQRIEVWDRNGNVVHQVANVPMAENIPIEGVRLGPRNVTWKPGEPATVIWTEALDGGDPRREAEHRDRWMMQSMPVDGEPTELVKLEQRAVGAGFFEDPSQVVTYEYDRDRRWLRALLHDLSQPGLEPKVLVDRSIRDRYGDPGSIVSVPDETGHYVALQHGDWIYRIGAGATPKGMLPFLDRQNINTLETERLWRCAEGGFEQPIAVTSQSADGPLSFVTRFEGPVSPPNYRLREIEGDRVTPLTEFPDPTPQIRGIKKQLVKYERADGVPLSATLYLPADYVEGTRLPLLVWAYPIEFNDVATAGQVTSSPWFFTTIRGSSHLALLTQGYAVMDGATMPIVGHPETMNDTFIEQLVAAAQAAIDKAVEMGVADPQRVAVGGHSYGAFMTANLLAHCDLFQAGIARSGAYNRTLTPFGFQSERRPLWEAKEVYFNISPFMHAHTINEPLLLIHGEKDNNPGTFPTQSKRLFQAIKGNGGTARLVMLPEESHGYQARESVLHVQVEMLDWLDQYVKHGTQPAPDATAITEPR